MIIGIGVDTTTISRIEKSMARAHFMARVFGAQEQQEFSARGNSAQSIAAAFAAKEAFSKALGTGLSGFVWTQLQVLHTEQGAPYFIFTDALAQTMQGKRAHLSITHEGDYATAFVVLEE